MPNGYSPSWCFPLCMNLPAKKSMIWIFVCTFLLTSLPDRIQAGPTVDELPDITGGVIPLLTFELTGGGQLFSGGHLNSRSEVFYEVRVKNQSGDPIEADSLVVVVEQIQDMARLHDVTDKVDLPGSDGETETGKPYYQVPTDGNEFLAPYQESAPFRLEIQNPNLFRLYPPVLRVRGVRVTVAQRYQESLSGMESPQ